MSVIRPIAGAPLGVCGDPSASRHRAQRFFVLPSIELERTNAGVGSGD